MPFTPFKKGSNSHLDAKGKGTPKPSPTPAGPGGQFDPNDSPGMDENGDGIYGRPVKRSPKSASGKAFAGLKSAKPGASADKKGF